MNNPFPQRPWPIDVYVIVAPRAAEIVSYVSSKAVPLLRTCMECGEQVSIPVHVFERSRLSSARCGRPIRSMCVHCIDQFDRVGCVHQDEVRKLIAHTYATWQPKAA